MHRHDALKTQRYWLTSVVLAGFAAIAPAASTNTRARTAPDQGETADDAPYAETLAHLEPTPPARAIDTFELVEGFSLELAAAEPQVADPISVAWDEDGFMYVGEMRGYPYEPPPGGGILGRVKRLEDADGDGYYEAATVFADKVHWPSGIACWKGGVFVAAPPDILYLKDLDGDGIADVRRTVFTGFGTRKSEDIMNNLKWGLDHLIYGGSSYNGGEVRHADRPDAEPINVRGRDFRFDPVTEHIEAIGGTGDFGNCFDDWGNRFTCSAGQPFIHEVIPAEYVVRNPYLSVSRLVHGILQSDGRMYPISRPEPWRVVRLEFWDRWVDTTHDMRAARFPPQELAAQGYITGAAGIEVYRGSVYPPAFRGAAFVGEPAGNLVIQTELVPDGPTFVARRTRTDQEFMASTDNWFRPVNVQNGPDGCLHVLDMYREVIEDPSAIPEDILRHIDYYTGMDMGRVYRVVPTGFQRPARPRLSGASIGELVACLAHENGWHRDTAHRLIYERQERSAAGDLREMVRHGISPQARLHALWSLEGLAALHDPTVARALHDAHPAVRRHAVALAERRVRSSPSLRARILTLADDPDPQVRLQVAFSLWAIEQPEAVDALARLAARDAGNDWVRTAVLSAVPARAAALLERLLDRADFVRQQAAADWLEPLASIVGARQRDDEIASVLNAGFAEKLPAASPLRRTLVLGLAEGLVDAGGTLQRLHNIPGVDREAIRTTLNDWFAAACTVAGDFKRPERERVEAVRLLAHAPFELAAEVLAPLIHAVEPAAIQIAAVQSLSAQAAPEVGKVLVQRWSACTPTVRQELAEALFARPERLPALLDAIADETIPVRQLDTLRRQALLSHADPQIRRRARALLSDLQTPTRREAVERYRAALKLNGDAERGAEVFEAQCATCHKIGNTGFSVGPDLGGVQSRTPEELLSNILDPNQRVQPNYINYRVDLYDGRTFTGIIVGETPTTVILRRAQGVEDVILRDHIEDISSLGLSIMPEELETGITLQEMADLIRFIQTIQTESPQS